MNIRLPNGSSRNIISGNGFIPCCCFWSVTFFGTELHQTTSGYKNRVRIQAPRVVSIIAGKPIKRRKTAKKAVFLRLKYEF